MTTSARYLFPVLALALLLSAPAGAVDVTSCGQIIPSGQTADLVWDLDCPLDLPSGTLQELSAVYLEPGAKLHLNGFTLSGGEVGVGCGSRCTIEGPGTIADFPFGILSYGSTRATDLQLDSNDGYVIYQLGNKTLRATNVTVLESNGLVAVVGHRVKAENLSIQGCWYGIFADILTGGGVSVSGCGQRAIGSGTVRASGVTVVGNGGIGILAKRIVLSDSVITGNDTSGTGVDLNAERLPRLTNTTCELSANCRDRSAVRGLPRGTSGRTAAGGSSSPRRDARMARAPRLLVERYAG